MLGVRRDLWPVGASQEGNRHEPTVARAGGVCARRASECFRRYMALRATTCTATDYGQGSRSARPHDVRVAERRRGGKDEFCGHLAGTFSAAPAQSTCCWCSAISTPRWVPDGGSSGVAEHTGGSLLAPSSGGASETLPELGGLSQAAYVARARVAGVCAAIRHVHAWQ
eukprot:363163-Chlamydomonas_euryale.AAC.7